jgi:hypothetical protein
VQTAIKANKRAIIRRLQIMTCEQVSKSRARKCRGFSLVLANDRQEMVLRQMQAARSSQNI